MHQKTLLTIKRQPIAWVKIFANHTSDKGLISTIYRELLKLNSKETNSLFQKWAKDLNTHLSNIYKLMKKMLSITITTEMQIKTTV